ncbi:hypothetical protein BDV93DRAFT_596704 [Ceratobasidium sp. AG-I]|nr:hypothetical protein BDV93DRAFT_596704 [Ceratobasidium sp. AG-I]
MDIIPAISENNGHSDDSTAVLHAATQSDDTLQLIERIITLGLQRLSTSLDADPARPLILQSLGVGYMHRFNLMGEMHDIDKSIGYKCDSLWITPKGDVKVPERLSNLACANRARFERLGDFRNLEVAINCMLLAVSLTPTGRPDKPSWLDGLGDIHQIRFERLGGLPDIQSAITYKLQAVALVPQGSPEKPHLLGNLGVSYLRRFQYLGELEDIDDAIANLTRADLLAHDGHPRKSKFLSYLSLSHHLRFWCLEEKQDIAKGDYFSTRAIALAPPAHASMREQLHNLGLSYFSRYKSLNDVEELNVAISYQEQALLITPAGHAGRPEQLHHLGVAYLMRHRRLQNLPDIDQSINCLTDSLSLTPEQHPKLFKRFSNLGLSHCSRFEFLGERQDIDKATIYLLKAFELAPAEHVDEATVAITLGCSQSLRFKQFNEPEGLIVSIASFEKAARSTSSQPSLRFIASRTWAKLSGVYGISAQLPGYRMSMSLVPQLVWLGATVASRYESIDIIKDIATESASVAISAGDLNLALEWIEQGRAIVWKQILQLRTPLEKLAAVDPDLAQRLEAARQVLDQVDSNKLASKASSTNYFISEKAAQQRRRSAESWGGLLEQAQQLPDFRDFMRPKKTPELMLAAHSGAVVVINVHNSRCDALVLPGDNQVILVPLPSFSLEKATRARDKLRNCLQSKGLVARGFRSGNANADVALKEVLSLLWSDVAKPILDVLGYTKRKLTTPLPRLTWCTTGPLSFLPLHAAGRYDEPQVNVMDFVVSSYAPTLSTLLSPITAIDNFSGILAVGQSAARHGLPELPGTVSELKQIEAQVGKLHYTSLNGQYATVEAVLSRLDDHSWVHFACHAKQDPSDPMSSALYLYDGALDLATLTRKSDKRGGFAFLSACQTATGDDKMPDESVHLAAGMLMAGYSTVVATMWSVKDKDAPLIATEVYARLLEGGRPDSRKAAEALHFAVQSLRAKVGNTALMSWVPYVHMGI